MKADRVTFVAVVVLFGLLVVGCAPWKEGEQAQVDEAQESKGIKKADMKNPWARAKVGDYYIVRVPGVRQLKLEVVKANDVEVLVQRGSGESPEDFFAYNLQEEEAKYVPPTELPNIVSVEDSTMNVGGKMIRVKIVARSNGENRLVNTFSDELPLDGIVRSVMNGEVHHEVIDFLKN